MGPGNATGDSGQHASSDVGTAAELDLSQTQSLCRSCIDVLGVDGAAVAVLGSVDAREVVYATDAVIQQLDELQFILGEGPCIDAFESRQPVLVADLGGEQAMQRWPGFAHEAALAGAGAAFAFPLQAGGVRFGVLELYRRSPGEFSGETLTSALLIVESVVRTVLDDLAGQRSLAASIDNPEPLFGRREVHQATGMIAVQLGASVPEALSRLRAAAFARQRPIIEVARDVVAGVLRFPADPP